jgi:hypothetical protein
MQQPIYAQNKYISASYFKVQSFCFVATMRRKEGNEGERGKDAQSEREK